MASRRLAISFLCEDDATVTRPTDPSHSTPPPVSAVPTIDTASATLAPHVRSNHSQYLRSVHDALEHAGNTLAYSNHHDLDSSYGPSRPLISMSSRRPLGYTSPPTLVDLRSRSPVPTVDVRTFHPYGSDRYEREIDPPRSSHSSRSSSHPFEHTQHVSQGRQDITQYALYPPNQYPYQGLPANLADYSSYSRPNSASSGPPDSRSPGLSYGYAHSPEQRRTSTRSPIMSYAQPLRHPSTSPVLPTPRLGTTSPANYHFSQTPSTRTPLSISTQLYPQPSNAAFLTNTSHSSSYPYTHPHPIYPQLSASKSTPSGIPSSTTPNLSKSQPQSPFSGLEALVQAATEERRRLSGGSESNGGFVKRASTSPVADRSGSAGYMVQPEYQHQEYQPHHRYRSPVYPEVTRNIDAEPPRKRRRSAQDAEVMGGHVQADFRVASSHHPIGEDWNGASPVWQEPVPSEKMEVRSSERTTVRAAEEVPVKLVGNAHRPRAQDREQDAHEWFMEQYGVSSRSSASPLPSPRVSAEDEDFASRQEVSPPGPSASARMIVDPVITRNDTKARTPTPIKALEEELDDIESIRQEAPHDIDADVDADIEGALGLVTELVVNTPTNSLDVEDELLSLVDDSKDPGAHRATTHMHHRADRHSTHKDFVSNSLPSLPSLNQGHGKSSLSFVAPSTSERGLMPPPPVTAGMGGRVAIEWGGSTDAIETGSVVGVNRKTERAKSASVGASAPARKKPGPKPGSKPKQPPKPRKKSSSGTTKSRIKALKDEDAIPPVGRGKKASPSNAAGNKGRGKSGSVARSRSTSVLPAPAGSLAPEDVTKEEEQEVADGEGEQADKADDDKLYCICKTQYDEDRVMIACDRCDEWYHTQCVNMPDLEVDLVDQFICPPCVENNPELCLQTTYKRRCFAGLKHQDPSSPSACHKPARGAYSKYCSDECGIKYMRSRIDVWAAHGGDTQKLWETVKNAEKREGVVVCIDAAKHEKADQAIKMEVDGVVSQTKTLDIQSIPGIVKPAKSKKEREVERLKPQLDEVIKARERMKNETEVTVWRQRLTELAIERAERVDECGWDQRLCFDDEEWAEFGAGVLESYEENQEDIGENGDGDALEHGEWWCKGKKKCERHAGWQKLRAAEVEFEKDMKDASVAKLTTREREIRKRIEDILDPQDGGGITSSKPSYKPSNTKAPVNGHASAELNGGPAKKGKKKRAAT